MKKRLLKAATLFSSVLIFSNPALATVNCSGTISSVYTEKDGSVIIDPSFKSGYIEICNLKEEFDGVDSQACWGWFAAANTALTESRNVILQFAAFAAGECGIVSGAPRYFMLK